MSSKAPGFSVAVRKDLTLNVGTEMVLDFELRLGEVSDVVEVSSSNTGVDLASSSLANTVEGTTIRELPLNGRDWTQLATLQPGVVSVGKTGGMRSGDGLKMAFAGSRPTENNYRLDGIGVNDYASQFHSRECVGHQSRCRSGAGFSVVSNALSAEYGRGTGGVINAITRSGTNDLHGTLSHFLRNSALDARNFFDKTPYPPEFRRHQFGASAGGPMIKNRTFWFTDYGGSIQFLGQTTLDNVPSANARQGILSTGTIKVDPQVAKMLQLFPLPNAGLLGAGDTGLFSAVTNIISAPTTD